MNTFFNRCKLMTGQNALSNLPHELKMKNVSRPMVISEKMEAYPPFYKFIKSAFDNDKINIAEIVVSTASLAEADKIAEYIELYKMSECDSIVVVGRDAVISMAKLVRLAIEQGVKDVKDITHITTTKEHIPLYVVPVFYGGGDEARGYARCYDNVTSYEYVGDELVPNAVIVDEEMIFAPDLTIMASSIMYALASAVIAYTDKNSDIMTRTVAMSAIELLCTSINDDNFKKKPRTISVNLATSMVISGVALNEVRHDRLAIMTKVIAQKLHLPFSKVYAMLFPHYYEQILDADDISNMEVLLPIIGEERYSITPVSNRASEVVTNIRRLIDYLSDLTGFRYNLSDFGMRRDDIKSLARKIADKGIDYDLVSMTLERTF